MRLLLVAVLVVLAVVVVSCITAQARLLQQDMDGSSRDAVAHGMPSHSQSLSTVARTLQCTITITSSSSSSRHGCSSSMLHPPTGTPLAQMVQQVNQQGRLPQVSSSGSSWQHTLPLASPATQAPLLAVGVLGTTVTAAAVCVLGRQVVAWTIRLQHIWRLATQGLHMPLLGVQAMASATAAVELLTA
jgi:hypothetical protein